MSRPVYILNKGKKVLDIGGEEKTVFFGDDFHFVSSLNAKSFFTVSKDDYGGVVTIKGEPLGVIGVPSSVTGDGSIRVISIFNMDFNNPETGTTSTQVMRCPDESFKNYESRFTGPFIAAQGKETSYSGTFVDGWHDHNVLIELSSMSSIGTIWKTSETIENLANKNRGYSTAALCAWRYNPISSVANTQGCWYIPSYHELIEEGAHLSSIDEGFAEVKTTYDVGLGRVPYDTSSYTNDKSYYGSTYKNYQSNYGGNCAKYDVKFQYNRTTYYGTASDSGMAQAWIKLINENGKWTLDQSYHIA